MNDSQRSVLRATSYDVAYYNEHVAAGLDYAVFGDWQADYGIWITESMDVVGKTVLDVGCACGSIAWGIRAKSHVVGIDLNNHMIALGRNIFHPMRLYVCDSVNLHLFKDGEFDLIHSAQVAEHFRPDLVPAIFREWYRVLKPGGKIVVFLDTAESLAAEGRKLETEEPTHICIRPLDWWLRHATLAGFQNVRYIYEPRLKEHPKSFLQDQKARPAYNWPFFVFQKPETEDGSLPFREYPAE